MTDDNTAAGLPSWSDHDLNAAAGALYEGDAQPALHILRTSWNDLQEREYHVDRLTKAGEYTLDTLRALVAEDPADADRWLLLGGSLANAAATARGAGWASETSEEQVAGLRAYGAQAREALHRAAELNPRDPAPWCELMYCSMAAPDYEGEVHEVYARADALAPDLFRLNLTRFNSLLPKWHGSVPEVMAFARAKSAAMPPGHPLHALVALAHIEQFTVKCASGLYPVKIWRFMRYMKGKAVRAELDAASDRLLAGGRYRSHMYAFHSHNAFAAVYHKAEALDRLRPHLEIVGDRWLPWPWDDLMDTEEDFLKARQSVGLAG